MKKPNLGFLVADGFEDIELFSTIDICKRAGINCILYSVDNLEDSTSAYGVNININNPFNDIKLNLLDGIVIPGGPAVKKLNNYDDVHKVVSEFFHANKLVAAICAGPTVLEMAKILKGKKITCYPTKADFFQDGTVVNQRVCVDNNIITSMGPATAIDFALKIVEYFFGEDIVENIKQDILL